ncbi:hypothetical protein SG34_029070 [Thalassomonas viridans]|uniref:Uncharacterized protein n=1 Tax=Thalassomonas viridans TaxID=137584 RepID=A0AAF0C910_9GAMM|nr:hypothetical protein [Thalassomonas viridans]WDE05293.1 hypothetical protein SG34_029070 [Thalassomonas viridans]
MKQKTLSVFIQAGLFFSALTLNISTMAAEAGGELNYQQAPLDLQGFESKLTRELSAAIASEQKLLIKQLTGLAAAKLGNGRK